MRTLNVQRFIPVVLVSCPRTLFHGSVETTGHFPAPIAMRLVISGGDGADGIS